MRLKEIVIDSYEYELFSIISYITYDNTLYNKLHDEHIKVGDKLRLVVEDSELWCDVLIEDIEYGDGTIWMEYLGDNNHSKV